MNSKLTIVLLPLMLVACHGRMYIAAPPSSDRCAHKQCPAGTTCENGNCVKIPSALACNFVNQDGACLTGETCVGGVCYQSTALPPACGPGVDGTCPTGQSCVNGACQTYTAAQGCGSSNPNGLCQGGQVCVEGWCYDDQGIACSGSNHQGVCPSGQTCTQGACTSFAPSCSPNDFYGLCATWNTCAEGVCVGPTPPAAVACSASSPAGLCPAAEICVAGVCTNLSANNACSSSTPTGLCPAGAGCADGRCLAITSQNACSAAQPGGVCTGGALCVSGQCQSSACGTSGGWQCALGSYCNAGTCDPFSCDPVHPDGLCADSTLTCPQGICQIPSCSAQEPNGTCQANLICNNGNCTLPPCSPASPVGPCPTDDYTCSAGVCVKKPCSPQVLDGTCSSTTQTLDPNYGYIFSVNTVCCDPNLAAATSCSQGTCSAPACSATSPHGACPNPLTQFCNNGACQTAGCSVYFSQGTCTDSNKQCILGRCTLTGCVGQPSPNAFCAPQICDTDPTHRFTYDTCQTPPCAQNPNVGYCPVGQACCNAALHVTDPNCTSIGTCYVPTCSATYLGGTCPGNEVCADGNCLLPPCSAQEPNGQCGANFSCVNGNCLLNACSAQSPRGSCAAGHECVANAGSANFGTCQTYQCSNDFPTAPCPIGKNCVNQSGTYGCLNPNCSSQYPGGSCADSNQICSNGSCITPACSPTHQEGLCPTNEQCCDASLHTSRNCIVGTCVPINCSVANPNGYCSGFQVCCNGTLNGAGYCPTLGQCVAETCSTFYPTGSCPSGQICASGACQTPCSKTALTGWCASGYACVNGGCGAACTNDQDCDTISDSDEGRTTSVDTDHDGSPDYLDRDSDNDLIPDTVEAGDHDISTRPLDTDGDGIADFRSLDSDSDRMSDTFEAGPVPSVPRDTDSDGAPDYRDTDSDGDGILDKCEATDAYGVCQATNSSILANSAIVDTNHDGHPDYRDLDSDSDGVKDHIEARNWPAQDSTFSANGIDHDNDGTPDYRDLDSDGDGVQDKDEDRNGNGIVDCQLASDGNNVPDTRATPACNDANSPFTSGMPYNFNPGCPTQKCLLAETSRVNPDTNGNSIPDNLDAIYLTCGTSNLKSVNVFYNQTADYAFALEPTFTVAGNVSRGGSVTGFVFDDPNTNNGSYGVGGFLLSKAPSSAAMAVSGTLQQKAISQAQTDGVLLASASGVASVALIINRNFVSFDGYGVVVSRYDITTTSALTTSQVRDALTNALDSTITNVSSTQNGPTATDFTLEMETLYRYDNGSTGRVVAVGAVTPTGTNVNSINSYNYRTNCSSQSTSGGCTARPGCVWNGSVCNESSYQIPLFYADNISNGSALTQYGNDLASLCQSLIQQNGLLDFLWVIDNSISMAPKIGQVASASSLFFQLLGNTEADYRVGQVTSAPALDSSSGLNNDEHLWKPDYPGCWGLRQSLCESASGTGGCTWDTNNAACVPLCSPFATQGACLRAGCAWANGACSFGGCGVMNIYTTALNTFCTGQASQSACQTNGCTWSGSACSAWPNCSTWTDSGSCESNLCYWAPSPSNTCVQQTNQTLCQYLGCSWNGSSCNLTALAERANGILSGDFTGAIAGQITTTSLQNRSNNYACAEGCEISSCNGLTTQACNAAAECLWNGAACVANCCPVCNGASPPANPNDPACYFAARLPTDNGNGYEFGLLMAEWAMYRAGAMPSCGELPTQQTCTALSGCIWTTSGCTAGYCAITGLSAGAAQEQCNGNNPIDNNAAEDQNIVRAMNLLNQPYGADVAADEYEPANCEWDPSASACLPSYGAPCAAYEDTQASCNSQGTRCRWDNNSLSCVPNQAAMQVLCSASTAVACNALAPNWCQWDTCASYTDVGSCQAVYGCGWTGSACNPVANGGTCRPPLKRSIRANASKVAVILSDEEECYVKDGQAGGGQIGTPYDGACDWFQYGGGLLAYNDPIRTQRTNSYLNNFLGRNFMAFALVGDKADPTNPNTGPRANYANNASCPVGCTWYSGDPNNPTAANGITAFLSARCMSTSNPNLLCPVSNGGCFNQQPNGGRLLEAEAGQAYINVAEGTGGGWGSICASNLYPSIEATVIASLGRASPYKLYGYQNGQAVQAIASTIQVGVETCVNAAEYPSCSPSGVTAILVPRSRSNGFDYDSTNNSIVLYGSARAVTQGDIVISYRYWVNRNEPPAGPSPTCPCPETSGPSCACPAGLSCGISGANPGTNICATHTSAGVTSCNNTAGCMWNSADGGFCEATGICKPDPTCGGRCTAGQLCDAATGLCVCDTGCGTGCAAGQACDSNTASPTCGQCECDTTCGGFCPAGQVCNANTTSPTCGLCQCDTTCAGGCLSGATCNTDPNSTTCGLCAPPACGNCPAGQVCNPNTGACVCDTTCGGVCPAGTICNGNWASPTCGQCECDPTCGGVTCPAGELCNGDPNSATCGFCSVDPTCGGRACNIDCSSGTTASACNGIHGCYWATPAHSAAGCYPSACAACNPSTGLCSADPTCCNACSSTQVCNSSSGSCICDTSCGGACASAGFVCDNQPASATCGQCVCDTTCGGRCPAGDICDTNVTSSTCGQCIIDPTCGGSCSYPLVCNPVTGLCGPSPNCGVCPQGYVCNTITGQCIAQGG